LLSAGFWLQPTSQQEGMDNTATKSQLHKLERNKQYSIASVELLVCWYQTHTNTFSIGRMFINSRGILWLKLMTSELQ